LIPRTLFFETKYCCRETIERVGLDYFIDRGKPYEIARYRLVFHGLVVQELSGSLHVVKPGDRVVFTPDTATYCRWHESPLEERDNPVERKYCTRKAETHTGFCNQHRNTPRAYYSLCFESMSLENILRYCWSLDEKMGSRVEYAVYLLAYSSSGFKVGSTRYWRLRDRVAEQPHVIATLLYKFDKALKTREVESTLGKLDELTEVPKRSLHTALNTPIQSTVARLAWIKAKIEKTTGLKTEENEVFRVDPGTDAKLYLTAKTTSIEYLIGKSVEVVDYYAGYLLLSEANTNAYYLIKASSILHRDVLKAV